MDSLLPRLNPKNMNGGPSMPFELEVSLVSYILEYVGLCLYVYFYLLMACTYCIHSC